MDELELAVEMAESEIELTVDVPSDQLPAASGLNSFADAEYMAWGPDLAAVQSAISEKSGVASPAFPEGFVEAVEGMKKYYRTTAYDVAYQVNEVNTSAALTGALYKGAEVMESFLGYVESVSTANYEVFNQCPALKVLRLPRLKSTVRHMCQHSPLLELAQIGSVGYPVSSVDSLMFRYSAAKARIEIYVDASAISDVPSGILSNSPFGMAGATIVYRNSTTGEVITA